MKSNPFMPDKIIFNLKSLLLIARDFFHNIRFKSNINDLKQNFKNKKIAIIGGAKINKDIIKDRKKDFDYVFAVNFKRHIDVIKQNFYTHILVGADLELEETKNNGFINAFKDEAIISHIKNKKYFMNIGRNDVSFYPGSFPLIAANEIARKHINKYDVFVDRLPRSGFLTLYIVSRLLKPKEITLFGFSLQENTDYISYDYSGNLKKISEIDFSGNKNHCSLEMEKKFIISLLKDFENNGGIAKIEN